MLETASYATELARVLMSGTGGVIERARSMVSGDAQFFSVAPRIDDLRYALASESVYEKRDAMKKIIAQMCKGVDMHALFPDVVKNIHVASMELRKLIYLFVVHYADVCPNVALLSTSAFQKDLVDPSMHVRSLALRMLSSMQIPAIHPVVMVAVRKCSTDSSPVVRKTAAIALWQMSCIARRETDMASVHEVLGRLLADKSADVVGAAVMAFERICPHRVELLHQVYRHLCEVLPECEVWGQDVLLRVLLRYARTQFCDPTQPAPDVSADTSDSAASSDSDGSGGSSGSSSSSSSSSTSDYDRTRQLCQQAGDEPPLDADHQLLLTAARPLLFSLSATVVVGVCALYAHTAPQRYLDYCVKPLMRVLRSAKEGHCIVLNTIHTLLERRPHAFAPYIKEFYLLSQDSADVRALKHRVLAQLATKESLLDLFQEYKCYVRAGSDESVAEAVRGLGLIVSRHASFSTLTIRLLTPLLSSGSPMVITEALTVLRLLVVRGRDTSQSVKIVFRLMQDAMRGEMCTPSAVSTVLWLVGEFLRLHPAMAAAAPDCFRVFVQRFSGLPPSVKQEVLTLGCKIWVALDGAGPLADRFRDVFFYALELAHYDDNYAIRDHGRLLESARDRTSPAFAAVKAAFEDEKPQPRALDPLRERAAFELGTFSNYFGVPTFAYEPLPNWRTQPPDPALRRPPRVASDNALGASPWAPAGRGGGRHGGGNGTLSSSSSYSSSRSPSSSSRGSSSSESVEAGRGEVDFYSDASLSDGSENQDGAGSSSSGTRSDAEGDATGPKPSAKPPAIKIVIRRT